MSGMWHDPQRAIGPAAAPRCSTATSPRGPSAADAQCDSRPYSCSATCTH